MNFTHYALGQMESGSIVEVTLLGSAANVRLMDSANFQNYRRGRRYRFVGGAYRPAPKWPWKCPIRTSGISP